MNQFAFFISLIILFNLSSNLELDRKVYEILYDKAILVIKGMTTSESYLCYNTCKDNKDALLDFILDLIPLLKSLPEDTPEYKILDMIYSIIKPDFPYIFLDNCQVYDLIRLFSRFRNYNDRIGLIKEFGTNIKTNNKEFYEGSSNFVKVRGIDGKLILVGKILSAVTGLHFNLG